MKQQVIRIKEEAGRCLLCHEPKCNEACPHGIDVGRIVRALNFENRVGARRRLPAVHYCENCDAPCMQACRRGKLDVRKCVGCHLCLLVCPVQAIEPGKRVKKTK